MDSLIAKLSWCNRECWHIIYRIWRISLSCGSGIVNDVTK